VSKQKNETSDVTHHYGSTEAHKDHLSQRTTLHAWAYVFVIAPLPSLPLSSKHLEHLEYLYLNFYINPLLIKVPLLFNIYYTFIFFLKKNICSRMGDNSWLD
jgi:hypothetical protein